MAAGATYEPIQTYTLGSAASSIDFTSIANSWTDLRLVIVGLNNTQNSTWSLRFNSDTGSNYSYTFLYGIGTSAGSFRSTNQTLLYVGDAYYQQSGTVPSMATVDIFSYAGSTNKTVLSSTCSDTNGGGTVGSIVGLWRSTSAITSIKVLNDASATFQAGTTATLYGIKCA